MADMTLVLDSELENPIFRESLDHVASEMALCLAAAKTYFTSPKVCLTLY